LFEAFGSAFVYHLDFKAGGADVAEAAMREVRRAHVEERTYVTGYNLEQLLAAKAIVGEVRVGWTISAEAGTATADALVEAAGRGACEVAVHCDDITPALLEAAVAHGVAVRAFGLATPADARRALARGATALTLDDPRVEWLGAGLGLRGA